MDMQAMWTRGGNVFKSLRSRTPLIHSENANLLFLVLCSSKTANLPYSLQASVKESLQVGWLCPESYLWNKMKPRGVMDKRQTTKKFEGFDINIDSYVI